MRVRLAVPDPAAPAAIAAWALLTFLAVRAGVGARGLPAGEPSPPVVDPSPSRSLEERFREPPADRRILQIIHGFPEDPAARAAALDRLVARGFGGLVVNVSFRDYLRSEERWEEFRAGVEAAEARGLVLWLYDEDGYPSAAAGGLTLEGHPELEAEGLHVLDVEIPPDEPRPDEPRPHEPRPHESRPHESRPDGPRPGDPPSRGKRTARDIEIPDGEPVFVAAYPVRDGRVAAGEAVDLLGEVRASTRPDASHPDVSRPEVSRPDVSRRDAPGARTLRWDRSGSWRILGFFRARLHEGTHAEWNLYTKRPYPNLLLGDATRRFLERTHAEYDRRFSPLARRFQAIFTDEPSLMSVFIRERPWAAIPWSSRIADDFRLLKGYDLVPRLPWLVADLGPEAARVRCDFWDVVGTAVSSSYFGQIQDWCRAHGIASTGHLLAEEDLGSHIGFYGNFYACAERLDWPGIDCLTSLPPEVPWHVAKLIGSIACVRGRQRTMSETSDHSQRWRPPGDPRPRRDVSAAEILGTAHLLYVAGINTTTSYYSWAGLDDAAVKAVNDHIGRLGAMLEGGRHVADVAVLYPLESAWAAFTPMRLWARAPEVIRIDAAYREVLDILFRWRIDFDVVDSRAVSAADAAGGSLGIGSERFRVLVLPAVTTLPAPAVRKVLQFARAGGIVAAVGAVPANTPTEIPSAEALAAFREILPDLVPEAGGEPARCAVRAIPGGGVGILIEEGHSWLLPAAIRSVLEPDLEAAPGSPLRYAHRRKEAKDLYFIINDSPRPASDLVTIRGSGPATLWDPGVGRISIPDDAGPGRWRIGLPPYGATFLFPEATRAPRPPATPPGSRPLVRVAGLGAALAARPRALVRGPAHVRAELDGTAVPPGGGAGEEKLPPLEVSATIEQGGVDSWCFLELAFDPPLDLSGYRALEVRVGVPPGQDACGARLLAILCEGREAAASAESLADLRRALGRAGSVWSAAPLDAFRLAGWSPEPAGPLDRSAVTALRLGWGGYIGKEGERVRFTVEAVRLLATP